MGIWDRLRRALGGDERPGDARLAGRPEPPPAPASPAVEPGPEAAALAWLDAAVARAAAGVPPAPVDLWPQLEALRAAGRERLIIEWLDKLVVACRAVAPELADELAWRASAARADRGELREALPALTALAQVRAYAARANFLLAEHHRRDGDLRAALRHLEAVLADDVDYPNARVRATAIRAELATTAPAPAATGDTISGLEGAGVRSARWQLVAQLGRGASGAVYLARDVELERQVAIKLLHPHLAAARSAGERARFFEEARVAAALRHPGVIAILDLDEDEKRIVMEYAAGGTLRARLVGGPLAPREAIERHVELLDALAAAHARGVVHRDVKPGNLLLRRHAPDSELVLSDFGVAHLAGADRRAAEREPVGTLGYMAPEQRRAEEAAPAADVYAAAVILHECLVGRLPWSQEALLAGQRKDTDLRLPAPVRAALGPAADAVDAHLAALAAIDPARRPDTSAALAAARELAARLRFPELEAAVAAVRAELKVGAG